MGQGLELAGRAVELLRQCRTAQRIDVGLFVEIQVRFQMSDHIQQMVAQSHNGTRQAAGQLLERGVELSRIHGVDDAQHGLGAGQVDPP